MFINLDRIEMVMVIQTKTWTWIMKIYSKLFSPIQGGAHPFICIKSLVEISFLHQS